MLRKIRRKEREKCQFVTVIEANNASNVGLKKRDVQLARREVIMDGRVCANRVKINELNAKVALAILDALVEY